MDIINQNTLNNIFTEEFFVHFDLEGDKHQIPISQSIITEQSIEVIMNEINRIIFNNQFNFELVVFAEDEGGLIKKFGVSLVMFVAGAMAADTINGVISAFSGGKERKDYVENETIAMIEVTKGFLEQRNEDLSNNGVSYDQFYKAFDAKNNFYQASLKNSNVKGIGFDKSHSFPLSRQDFIYRITDLSSKLSTFDPIDKYHELIVISSINTQEDKELSRKVKDKIIEKRFDIYMNDKNFYEGFLKNPFFIKNMIVKVRYNLNRNDNGEIQIVRKEIIKVYQHNDVIRYALPKGAIIEPAPRRMEGYSLQEYNPNGEGTLFEGSL